MKRVQIKTNREAGKGGRYFDDPSKHQEMFPSGCALLDCVLGGGWALGRFNNIVGDKSTGKTLLAIEALANFAHYYEDGWMRYRDSEAAFSVSYAQTLGLPLDRVDLGDGGSFDTVEDFCRDVVQFLDHKPKKVPGLYILDSLDALTDEAEKKRDPDSEKGSYGTGKAKKMSEFFRKLVRRLERERTTLIIISQVRDNIGVMFGEKHTRVGGRALDFYASVVLWLSQIKHVQVTKKKVKRDIGVIIKAKAKKNKVGRPYRDCQFPILFEFGIDDVTAGLQFLIETEMEECLDWSCSAAKALDGVDKMDTNEYRALRRKVIKATRKAWREIEARFTPKRSKYE